MLAALVMKSSVFWDVLAVNGVPTFRSNMSPPSSESKNIVTSDYRLLLTGLLLGLLLDRED
jgi:hypothetical protein